MLIFKTRFKVVKQLWKKNYIMIKQESVTATAEKGEGKVSYIHIEPKLSTSTTDWLDFFLSSNQTRPHYLLSESHFRFQRVGIRVLGIPLDEDEYYNSLFDLSQKGDIRILSQELDKSIDNEVFKAIQEVLLIHQQEPNGLSVNRLVANLYGRNLIPKHKDPYINRHVQLSTIKIMEHFRSTQKEGLLSSEFRRFMIDMIKWLKNHWEKWSESLIVGSEFPKVIWYGDINISQQYFLLLLMELGCDVLVFHPEGKDVLIDVDKENSYSIAYEYTHKGQLEPFPTQLRDRQTTVAYRANKQLEMMLNDYQSGVYKPWQFREFLTSSTTLRMTYDDIFLYAKEKAMIRSHFKVESDKVIIPVVFAKVSGVSKDREDYWDKMAQLKRNPLALTIRHFPYINPIKANYHFHYQHSLDRNGILSVEKMMKGNWWRYGHLPTGLQKAIAHTIKRYCENPKLKKLEQETELDLRAFLFKQANNIPEEILQRLQKFDYPQEVPCLILYNMETNGEPSREDAALMAFLNEFGVDLVLYNPAGHTDIEKYIDSSYYDTHWLEEIAFEQEFQELRRKEKSILKKIMNGFFK